MPPQVHVYIPPYRQEEDEEEEEQQQQPQSEIQRDINELTSTIEKSRDQISSMQNEVQKIIKQSEQTQNEIELTSTLDELRREISDMRNEMQRQAELFKQSEQKKNESDLSSIVEALRCQVLDIKNEMQRQIEFHEKEKLQWTEEKESIKSQLALLHTHIAENDPDKNIKKLLDETNNNDQLLQKESSVNDTLNREHHQNKKKISNRPRFEDLVIVTENNTEKQAEEQTNVVEPFWQNVVLQYECKSSQQKSDQIKDTDSIPVSEQIKAVLKSGEIHCVEEKSSSLLKKTDKVASNVKSNSKKIDKPSKINYHKKALDEIRNSLLPFAHQGSYSELVSKPVRQICQKIPPSPTNNQSKADSECATRGSSICDDLDNNLWLKYDDETVEKTLTKKHLVDDFAYPPVPRPPPRSTSLDPPIITRNSEVNISIPPRNPTKNQSSTNYTNDPLYENVSQLKQQLEIGQQYQKDIERKLHDLSFTAEESQRAVSDLQKEMRNMTMRHEKERISWEKKKEDMETLIKKLQKGQPVITSELYI